MPVVSLRYRVPGPVGRLEIFEDDSGVPVSLRRFAPDIIIFVKIIVAVVEVADPSQSCPAAVSARGYSTVACNCAPRFLEPRILIGRVIDHEFGDYTQIALVGCVEKCPEI